MIVTTDYVRNSLTAEHEAGRHVVIEAIRRMAANAIVILLDTDPTISQSPPTAGVPTHRAIINPLYDSGGGLHANQLWEPTVVAPILATVWRANTR